MAANTTYQNYYPIQGSDFIDYVIILHPDLSPINVATYIFSGQLKTSYYTSNAAANLAISIVDAANGNIALTMNAAVTSNLSAGNYVYDVLMEDPMGNMSRIVYGIFYLQPGITNIIPPNSELPA